MWEEFCYICPAAFTPENTHRRAFLGRYMDNVSSARYLRDSLGFWNGKRGFQALLRESPKSVDGYLHPPAMFSLGADRGTLYYARQPPFCRRCMAYGHTLASCSNKKCRFCGSEEHEARECDEPKACHGCGSREHLWRDCPDRHRSYASAAGGGAGKCPVQMKDVTVARMIRPIQQVSYVEAVKIAKGGERRR
uniref:CCHC-type domain-containing protein n=1 Tax=Oncorhynchus kisutch TaxID=8019 RepID=A0A8C7DB00_ONCKI